MATYPSQPCPVCRRTEATILARLQDVPLYCNVLLSTREEALAAATGDIRLVHCRTCGMIYNEAFDADRMQYGADYENALHHSAVFREYSEQLARRLTADYHLEGKRILEIGCGDGHFLRTLCRDGRNRGWGIDPSHPAGDSETEDGSVTFIAAPYRASLVPEPVDLICCRHVLEHIADPRQLLAEIRRTCQADRRTVVFFEVPNAYRTFAEGGIWDILYEHCCYFTGGCLTRLFQEEGFRVLRTASAYHGQYLQIEAEWNDGPTRREPDLDGCGSLSSSAVEYFERQFLAKIGGWTHRIGALYEQEKRVVIWGAGTKGASFLNMLNVRDQIHFVADINPRKAGRFVPRTGQQVVLPATLNEIQPHVVIVMNPAYESEIRHTLEQLSLSAEVLSAEKP